MCVPTTVSSSRTRRRSQLAEACGLAGWRFLRLGVPDPVLTANVTWLSRYRHPRFGVGDVAARLVEVFTGPVPLMPGVAEAGDPIAVLPVLFHLLWCHILTADLAARLTAGTLVVAGRLGRCPVTGRPGELGIGDRVEFGGRARTVISVSGTVIRLADRDGQVAGITVSELVSAEDFALVDTRPRLRFPKSALLNDLPEEAVARALWWQRQIVEVLRGVPPDAEPGPSRGRNMIPAVSLTRREQAKAAELTAAGFPVTASAVKQRRRRYQERGLLGMVDHRVRRRLPPHGRADAAVAGAMRQAIAETAGDSTRTAAFVLRRTRQILAASDEQAVPEMPSERTLYRLFDRLQAGKHATGSARTRRSLAARPDAPFGLPAAAPGEVMEIDSTPLDVLVRLDDGVIGRVELTALVDVATRTVTAAVLRPTTKAVDASVLLARTVTPEPMRPGWPQAMAMAESALPFRRLLSIDERLEHAAARPVIIPHDRGRPRQGVRVGVVQGLV